MKREPLTKPSRTSQKYRVYSDGYKRKVVSTVNNRGKSVSIESALKPFGVHQSLYYKWREMFKTPIKESVVPATSNLTGNTVKVTEIRVGVNLTNVNDVIKMVDKLKRIPGVHGVIV